MSDPGKGGYWSLDYSEGLGTKRPRKRNKRKTKAEKEAERRAAEQRRASTDEEDTPEYDESSPSPALSQSPSITPDPFPPDEGHRVDQSSSRRPTRRSKRDRARRASPYSESPRAANNHPLPSRQAPIALPAIPGSRNPSATFGQPSFGQPSLGPTPSAAVFGRPSLFGLGGHLAPHPRAVSAAAPFVPASPSAGPSSTLTVSTRSFTQPVPSSVRGSAAVEMEIDPALLAEDAAFAGGLQLRGTGISAGARLVQQQRDAAREFVQGSSRGGGELFASPHANE